MPVHASVAKRLCHHLGLIETLAAVRGDHAPTQGLGPIGENELHLHQNAVELSLVNACIAFKRLGLEEGFLTK